MHCLIKRSRAAYFNWRAYGGVSVSELKRMKELGAPRHTVATQKRGDVTRKPLRTRHKRCDTYRHLRSGLT
jgi:hypothetical protein